MVWTILGQLNDHVLESNAGDLLIVNPQAWKPVYGYYVVEYYATMRGHDWYSIRKLITFEN